MGFNSALKGLTSNPCSPQLYCLGFLIPQILLLFIYSFIYYI